VSGRSRLAACGVGLAAPGVGLAAPGVGLAAPGVGLAAPGVIAIFPPPGGVKVITPTPNRPGSSVQDDEDDAEPALSAATSAIASGEPRPVQASQPGPAE
jgi:hypothetical protein